MHTKSANKYTTLTLCISCLESIHVAMTRYIYITNCNLDTTLDTTDHSSFLCHYEETKDFSLYFVPYLRKYFCCSVQTYKKVLKLGNICDCT